MARLSELLNRGCGVVLFLSLSIACTVQEDFGELSRLAAGKTDKMDTHGFTEIYEHIFHPLRNQPLKILEIGVWKGGSLRVWHDYFSRAQIFGIDVFDTSFLNSERITTAVANQASREDLDAFIESFGGDFDIIIDDGGHTMEQQQISLGHLFPHVKPGGYYVIEDLHSSLGDRFPQFGAETDGSNTTLTMVLRFVQKGDLESRYLTRPELDYLKEQIEYCNLFLRTTQDHSMTCILRKKLSVDR